MSGASRLVPASDVGTNPACPSRGELQASGDGPIMCDNSRSCWPGQPGREPTSSREVPPILCWRGTGFASRPLTPTVQNRQPRMTTETAVLQPRTGPASVGPIPLCFRSQCTTDRRRHVAGPSVLRPPGPRTGHAVTCRWMATPPSPGPYQDPSWARSSSCPRSAGSTTAMYGRQRDSRSDGFSATTGLATAT